MSAFADSYCEDNNIKSPRTLYAEKSKTFTNDETQNPYKHDLSTKEENFTTPDKIYAENAKTTLMMKVRIHTSTNYINLYNEISNRLRCLKWHLFL